MGSRIGRSRRSRARIVVDKRWGGGDAVTSILYQPKQAVSGHVCVEMSCVCHGIGCAEGAGRADRHGSAVAA